MTAAELCEKRKCVVVKNKRSIVIHWLRMNKYHFKMNYQRGACDVRGVSAINHLNIKYLLGYDDA